MSDKESVESLVEDKAKRDASYEYTRKDWQPVADGAFKGAVTSGVVSKFLPSNKKAQALGVLAGAGIGAISGKLYNNSKVDKAKKARLYLADKRKSRSYVGEAKQIYKQSSDLYDSMSSMAEKEAHNAVNEKNKSGTLSSLRNSGISGALFGGVTGFAMGGKGNRMMSALKGASLGATGAIADDGLRAASNEIPGVNDNRIGAIGTMAATGAASGLIEPVTSRLLGRYVKNEDFLKKEISEANKAEAKRVASQGKGIFSRFGNKNKIVSDYAHGASTRGGSIGGVFKNIKTPSLRAAGKYGAMSALLGMGLDYFTHKNKNPFSDLGKSSAIHMTADEVLRGKDGDAQNRKDSGIPGIIGKSLLSGAVGYGVSRALGGSNKIGALVGGASGGAHALLGAKDLYDANSYLKKNKSAKLHDLYEETRDSGGDSGITPSSLYLAALLS